MLKEWSIRGDVMIQFLKVAIFFSLIIFVREFIVRIIIKKIRIFFYIDEVKKSTYFEGLFNNKHIVFLILISVFIFFISIFNGNGVINSFLYVIFFILLVSGYKKIRGQIVRKEVLYDLLNVCECLRVQLSSGISLETAIKSLPELCKNKEFSEHMTNIYLEYELYKFTLNKSAKVLEERFNYSEIKMFVSALKQQSQHTSMLELIDNLIEILEGEYIEFLEDSTKNKMMIMTLGVFIIVVNIAIMGIYPVLVESFTAINGMFN